MSDHDHATPHIDRKEYWKIFTWLTVLTALEVGIVYVPGISTAMLLSALGLLALTKAALVALFFMHLNHEKIFLRWTVALPAAIPAVYAFALIAEAAWRMKG